jgi:toxin secretion/phage lysis holin
MVQVGDNRGVQAESASLIAAKWIAAFIVSFWLRVPLTVQILVACMGLDFITGLLVAFIRGEVASHKSFIGLAKKTLILILVGAAHLISDAMKLQFDLGAFVAVAYIINEVISITENCANAGIPIPPALLDVLVKAKKYTGRGQRPSTVVEKLESVSVSTDDGVGGIETLVSSTRTTTGTPSIKTGDTKAGE